MKGILKAKQAVYLVWTAFEHDYVIVKDKKTIMRSFSRHHTSAPVFLCKDS